MTDNSSQKTKQNTNSNTKVLHRFQKKKIERSYYFNFNRCNNYINSKIKRQGLKKRKP